MVAKSLRLYGIAYKMYVDTTFMRELLAYSTCHFETSIVLEHDVACEHTVGAKLTDQNNQFNALMTPNPLNLPP